MKLTFAIALIFLAAASAQNCNNPLLAVFGFQGLAAPVSGAGLPYCSNLQNGETCCGNSTVVGFQALLDNITASLQELAGARDIYIAQLRTNYTDAFRDQVSDFTDYDGDVNDIQDADPVVGDPIKTQYDSFRQLRSELDHFDDSDNYKNDFIDYQNKRVICYTALLQIQSEVFCLACSPDWQSQGVQANGTITSAAAVCDTIQSACAPFTAASDKFNPLFQAQQSFDRLVGLTDWVKFYHDNDIFPNATLSGDVPVVTNATHRTNSQPPNCNDDTCTWQCANMFNGSFVLNQTVAGNGGGIVGGGDVAYPDVGVVQTVPNTTSGGRRLQSTTGTWNPDLANSQLTIVVVSDPAAVTNLDGSDASDADINDHLDGYRTPIITAIVVVLSIFAAILI